MNNLPDLNPDLPYVEYGEYLHTYELEVKSFKLEESFDMQNNCAINV